MAINWPNLASRRLSCAGHNWRQMRANTHPFMHLRAGGTQIIFIFDAGTARHQERERENGRRMRSRLTRGNMKRIFINPFSKRRVSIVVVCAAKGIERECEAHVNRRRVHAGAFYVCKDQLAFSLSVDMPPHVKNIIVLIAAATFPFSFHCGCARTNAQPLLQSANCPVRDQIWTRRSL
jgi:hypothetical protein